MPAARPLPQLNQLGTVTAQSFGNVAGPEAWKYAVSDNTPIIDAAFDFIGGLGSMLWEGLFGGEDDKNTDKPVREEVEQLRTDENDGTAAISTKLDDQTEIMQENLSVTKDLLAEWKGDKFKEIEEDREGRRKAPRSGQQAGEGLPSMTLPDIEDGMGLFSMFAWYTSAFAAIQAFSQGFLSTMPASWKLVLDTVGKLKKFNTSWADDALKAAKLELRASRATAAMASGLNDDILRLQTRLETARKGLKVGSLWTLGKLISLTEGIAGIFTKTFGIPASVIEETRRLERVVTPSGGARPGEKIRTSWRKWVDTWFGKAGHPQSGIIGQMTRSLGFDIPESKEVARSVRGLRGIGENIRTIVNLFLKPIGWVLEKAIDILRPLRGFFFHIGRFFGRFLAPILALFPAIEEFKKSSSLFNAGVEFFKEFFMLWIGDLADFFFVVIPGWLVETIAGWFGFDDFAAKVKKWRKEFHLGEFVWEGLMLLQSAIWNSVAGLINSTIDRINGSFLANFIDPIDWRMPYMESKTGHLYKDDGSTYTSANEAFESRFGPNSLDFMFGAPEVDLLTPATRERAQAAGLIPEEPTPWRHPAQGALEGTTIIAPTVNQGDTTVTPAPRSDVRSGQRGKQALGNRMRARR